LPNSINSKEFQVERSLTQKIIPCSDQKLVDEMSSYA